MNPYAPNHGRNKEMNSTTEAPPVIRSVWLSRAALKLYVDFAEVVPAEGAGRYSVEGWVDDGGGGDVNVGGVVGPLASVVPHCGQNAA